MKNNLVAGLVLVLVLVLASFLILRNAGLLGGSRGTATVSQTSTTTLDQYGGYTDLPVPGGATGNFRVGKLSNNHWVFADPLGNAFWMKGVYYVTGDDHVDELGSSYNIRFGQKYGTGPVGWPEQNRRLQSWGFNTLGPGTYRMLLPDDVEPDWAGGQQPVKMPFVNPVYGGNIGIGCEKSGAAKSLYHGLDQNVFGVYAPNGTFPDTFDPKFAPCALSAYASNTDLAFHKTSPYLVGVFGEDTDFLNGFGPGTDFTTDPAGKYHAHLGYIALVTAPTQATNPYASNAPYTDTKVYAKYALRDFLVAKYGTIVALNTAWGSNYTTFDSSGGWPAGTGLLDENGRASHTWLGSSGTLVGMNSQARSDLDDFLYQLSAKYFSADRAGLKSVAPSALYFGPTNLGGAGWRAPAYGPVLKAAGEYLDVINVGTDGSQAQINFIAKWAGDKPIAIWEGVTANPDSGRYRYTMEPASWAVSTQAQRGQLYQHDVSALVNGTVTSSGNKPFVGLMYWSYLDSIGEQANWGLVSLVDNAYDAKEAVIASGTDPWGYKTGGEEKNYGDFLSYVTAANASVAAALGSSSTTPPPPSPVCGNGVVETGEQCDLGSSNGTCPSLCSTSCAVNTCPATPPPVVSLTIGGRIKTTAKLNVRQSFSIKSKILGTQPLGALGTIVDGPKTNSGYSWWKINYDSGPDGWSADDGYVVGM